MFKYLETVFTSFIKEVYDNISKNWGMFFAAITVTSFSFFVLQLIILVYYNIENIKQKMISQITIHVYFDKHAKISEISEFLYNLESNDKVLSATLVSKEELIKRIKEELNIDYSDIPIGNVVYIKVKKPEFVSIISQDVKKYRIVKDVIYWQEYVENISSVFGVLKKILFGIIFFLCIGVILIINTTVKMSIISRKNEIRIMNLVGAAGWFIKAPLFTEIFIVLIISSMISHYFLRVGYAYILDKLDSHFIFFNLLPIDYLIFIRNVVFLVSVVVSFIFVYSTMERYFKKLVGDE
ncbi:MAG: permease-like cell division protein FtsX [Candidatus Calescibacterium sp.]|nr:permease-like cell division protein FtsX [Candidatus Calescibacterium sp.]MCX7972678.1 permease-like cell division protein FtsX [bacterium]MDW8194725.1 permease-like cell division protein FtsX [Candidatus Calescibacterium sp.]